MDEERRYEQYMPGDEVRCVVDIQHAPLHLSEVRATFRHEGDRDALFAQGVPIASNRQPPAALGLGMVSQAELEVGIERGTPTGVYKLSRIQVETFGGRVYQYEGVEDLADAANFGFEVVEEPDQKPGVAIGFSE